MTAKAKAKKVIPAKQPPKSAAKPTPEKAPELNIKVVRVGSSPSLSEAGVVDHEVGADELLFPTRIPGGGAETTQGRQYDVAAGCAVRLEDLSKREGLSQNN